MAADIGIRIGVEGENTFKTALSGINAKLKQLNSEMKATVSSMDRMGDEEQTAAKKSDILARSIEASKQKISILSQQYEKAEDKLRELGTALERASQEFGENSAEAIKAQNAYNRQAAAVSKLGAQIADATADLNRMEAELEDITSESKQAENALEKLGNEADSIGGKMSGGFSAAKVAIGNLISDGIQMAIEGIKNLASEALSAADSLTKFEGTMEFAGFSPEEIAASKQAVQDYASQTVYDLGEVANTTAQLAANGVKDFQKLTEAAGNLNAVAGGNADTFSSVAMVLTQTAGAGKLTTENWNQLADAIPGASGEIQKALLEAGAYTGNFREAMEKGQISAEEFNAAIMNLGMSEAAIEAAGSVTTFEGAVGNLQATLVDGMTALLTNYGGMELITGAISGLVNILSGAGAIVAPALDAMKNAFEGLRTTFQTIFSPEQQEAISGFFSKLASGIIAVPFAVLAAGFTVVIGLINAVLQVGAAIVGFFTNTLPNGIQTTVKWFEDMRSNVSQTIENILSAIRNWASNMVSTMSTKASEAVAAVVRFFSELPGKAAGILSQVLSALVSWGGNMVNSARSAIQNVVNTIASTLRTAISQMTSIGSQIVQGLASGIRNGISTVVNAVASVVASAVSTGKSKLGIRSPSRVFMGIGDQTVAGLTLGLEKNTKYAAAAAAGTATAVTDAFSSNLENITAPVPSVAAQVNAGFAKTSGNMLSSLLGAIQSGGNGHFTIEVPLYINGKELYRATIRDLNQALRDNSRAYGRA